MNPGLHRIPRCLLVCAMLAVCWAIAAAPAFPAPSAASGVAPKKHPLPAKKDGASQQWDRLDPGTIERASKSRAPKSPTFPAERS